MLACPRARKLSKTSSDYTGDLLNNEINDSIKEISKVQSEINKFNVQAKNEIAKVKKKFRKLCLKQYKNRAKQIARIPNFWLTAFKNNSEVNFIFDCGFDDIWSDRDDDYDDAPSPLHHFKFVEVIEFAKPKLGFKIDFHFDDKKNPFFKNKIVSKEFHQEDAEYDEFTCKSTKIDWDPHYKYILDDCNLDGGIFFAWLTDDNDDSYGVEIKDKIWTNPVKYFLDKDDVKSKRKIYESDSSDDKYVFGYGTYGSTFNDFEDDDDDDDDDYYY